MLISILVHKINPFSRSFLSTPVSYINVNAVQIILITLVVTRDFAASQPDTHPGTCSLISTLWDGVVFNSSHVCRHWKMNPRIFIKLQVSDIILTGILLICALYVLTWLIFLQATVEEWFKSFD